MVRRDHFSPLMSGSGLSGRLFWVLLLLISLWFITTGVSSAQASDAQDADYEESSKNRLWRPADVWAESDTASDQSLESALDRRKPASFDGWEPDEEPAGTVADSISFRNLTGPSEEDYVSSNTCAETCHTWQVMPAGLMYRSYLAGEKESRMASVWTQDKAGRTVWENTLGGRLGLIRFGTEGAFRPQGWQLDFEGAALARVLPEAPSTMLEATDYRAGFQLTWAGGPWHTKTGYYHLSSHLGDEFMLANPATPRFNYVRDSAIFGVTYEINNDWQTYGEIAYALGAEDGAEPLELQYGIQYSPLVFGLKGAPFAALNGHTRQDFDYGTSITAQAGWQWRGTNSQHLWRMGLQYYEGPALQYSFPGQSDRLLGGGLWFDF